MNLEAGYHITDNIQLSAALFNVFDSRDNDITYFYESTLTSIPSSRGPSV